MPVSGVAAMNRNVIGRGERVRQNNDPDATRRQSAPELNAVRARYEIRGHNNDFGLGTSNHPGHPRHQQLMIG